MVRMHSRNERVGTLHRVAEACLPPRKAIAILPSLIGFQEASVPTLSCLRTILHPACFLLCQGQNCRHYPLCQSPEPQVSITAIAFQMKGKQPGSPCSCQGSLRPKFQQRMLQCGVQAGSQGGGVSRCAGSLAPQWHHTAPPPPRRQVRPLECPQAALSRREKGSALQM